VPRQDDFQVERMQGVMNKVRGTKAILSLRAAGGCAAAVAGNVDDKGTGAAGGAGVNTHA